MHAALEWCKNALAYNIAGVITVQALLVTLMVPAIVNEIVSRRRKVTAWSLLQAIGNALKGSPLYKLPGLKFTLIKQAIDLASTPEDLKLLPPRPLTLPPPPLATEPSTPPPAAPGDGGAA
ncbi:MAG: hypothetical protein Q7J25_10260 [Vicinamibacterales bacterium]|nr:hypothetical protein [Vicinamibacterales bacterium]